jgi:UDP-N-acetylglucosamine 4,6-dehydratase
MTRFWITLEKGVNFVLDCLKRMVGGELFVPKIPSMNIMDLAKAVAPKCQTEIVGMRPGEKLHEMMISRDDARRTLEYGDYYIVQPDFTFFRSRFKCNSGKKVSEDFEYNSETNPWFLTIDEMRGMVKNI